MSRIDAIIYLYMTNRISREKAFSIAESRNVDIDELKYQLEKAEQENAHECE